MAANKDGTLTHNFIKEKVITTVTKVHPKTKKETVTEVEKFENKIFKSQKEFDTWVNECLKDRFQALRKVLTPHELYIMEGKNMERPFMDMYDYKSPGHYECKSCTQRLFMSEHKYLNKNGYPNFWNHILDSVGYREDFLDQDTPNCDTGFVDRRFKEKEPMNRVVCSNCESHVGFVYDDGPGPFFRRLTVNSTSLVFKEKPWFVEVKKDFGKAKREA